MKFDNLEGNVYGYLLVGHRASRPWGVKTGTFFRCTCMRCGRHTTVRAANLKNGTKSCGCLINSYHAQRKAGIHYDKSQHQGV